MAARNMGGDEIEITGERPAAGTERNPLVIDNDDVDGIPTDWYGGANGRFRTLVTPVSRNCKRDAISPRRGPGVQDAKFGVVVGKFQAHMYHDTDGHSRAHAVCFFPHPDGRQSGEFRAFIPTWVETVDGVRDWGWQESDLHEMGVSIDRVIPQSEIHLSPPFQKVFDTVGGEAGWEVVRRIAWEQLVKKTDEGTVVFRTFTADQEYSDSGLSGYEL